MPTVYFPKVGISWDEVLPIPRHLCSPKVRDKEQGFGLKRGLNTGLWWSHDFWHLSKIYWQRWLKEIRRENPRPDPLLISVRKNPLVGGVLAGGCWDSVKIHYAKIPSCRKDWKNQRTQPAQTNREGTVLRAQWVYFLSLDLAGDRKSVV